MKNMKNMFWAWGFINGSDIVFSQNNYIRIYSKSKSNLKFLQKIISAIFCSKKLHFNQNSIGIISKNNQFYTYTIHSLKDIVCFILFIKDNIYFSHLNNKLNLFVLKYYLKHKEFNNVLKYSFSKNTFYLKNNFNEEDIFLKEEKRIERIWRISRSKLFYKNSNIKPNYLKYSDINKNINKYWYQGYKDAIEIWTDLLDDFLALIIKILVLYIYYSVFWQV